MIGKGELSRIPDVGLLINSARQAPSTKAPSWPNCAVGASAPFWISFPKEPLPADSPFRRIPNVLFTPNTAGFSLDVYTQMGREIALDLLRWRVDEPLRLAVDARRWDLLV